jgi:Nucleotide modification associated domain 2
MRCYAVLKTPGGQPFPRSSHHTIWVDENLPDWINQEEGNVFSYKLTTLTKRGEVFIQDGNAPNYQGDRITLCTCMRWHRTWPAIGVGTWIAGFSGDQLGNELFYLMKVAASRNDFAELWNSNLLPDRDAKSACSSIYGDLYVPCSTETSKHPHDPSFYKTPTPHHKHHQRANDDEWHKDIDLWRPDPNRQRRRPPLKPRVHKLLIGQPGKSFVWEHPKYRYKRGHPRQQRPNLRHFLQNLETA